MTFTVSGFGVSSGSDDSEAGFGFKAGTYKTGFGSPTQGSIQEQSALFGKQDSYSSDWSKIRSQVEDIARKNGYVPGYHTIHVLTRVLRPPAHLRRLPDHLSDRLNRQYTQRMPGPQHASVIRR